MTRRRLDRSAKDKKGRDENSQCAAMRRADRRKGAHGGYQAIIDRIVAQIYWLRTNETKVVGLAEAQRRERKRPR
jgi:hypothetical protein